MRNPAAALLPLSLLVITFSGIANAKPSAHQLEAIDKIRFYARLTPVQGTKSQGSGAMTGYYDFYTHQVFWKLAYQKLTSRVLYAKIHGPSHPGHDAPVILPLEAPYSTPILGTVTVTGKVSAQITGGYAYVVVSTEKYPSGEIRGRIHRQK